LKHLILTLAFGLVLCTGLLRVDQASAREPERHVFPATSMDLTNKSAAYRQGIAAFNKRDFATAYRLFLPLAENGDVDAQVNIGMMYLQGWHLEQDYAKAVDWFLQAAVRGFATAQQNIAFMHMEGLGVAQDFAEAAKWYRLAAEQGDMMSQYNMGVLSRDGTGIKGNLKDAVTWFTKSARQSHVGATFNLGVMYRDGSGVAQDLVKAAKLFRAMAEINFAPAQFELGLLYFKGHGVERDYDQAGVWFHKAAKQNDEKAQYNLGVMYLNGIGYDKDIERGTLWIEKATANGHTSAGKVLKQLQAGLTPTSPAEARAHEINIRLCLLKPSNEPDIRINACTELLESGKLIKDGVPLAHYNRSVSHGQKQQYADMITDLDRVMLLKPDFPEAYNALAWLLATAKDARYRDGERAVELASRAIALKDDVNFRDSLAAAYAEAGRFAEAVAEQDRAIATLRAAGKHEAAASFRKRRDLYEQRQPARY